MAGEAHGLLEFAAAPLNRREATGFFIWRRLQGYGIIIFLYVSTATTTPGRLSRRCIDAGIELDRQGQGG